MATRLDTLKEARIEKLKKLEELGINPFPSVTKRTHTVQEALLKEGSEVSVAGRVVRWREHGNVVFADLKDESGEIQLFLQQKNLEKNFELLKLLDLGDFVSATGEVIKTSTGETSVDTKEITLLSKALRPMPSDWVGLKDIEERYRRRYLDLILNPEVKKRFDTRTKLVREIRRYLDGLGYMEVETPTLQPLYGGANAKPFKTHLNALDVDMYLRIADELYLKRLLVGGYEKVYEICKDFRNEGMDQTHNPEFTMIEYYEAYADYQKVMDTTEGMFKHLATTVLGDTKLQVGERTIDIGDKWPRIRMVDALKEHLNIDVDKETEESLVKYCKDNGIELLGGETKGQLIFTIFEHKVTDLLIEPTWIIDYPKEISPLSKDHRSAPGWVERFEGYIGGKEICDGWSELTNSIEQRARFEADVKATRKDKEEAQQVDEDFLEAMEYGMPPTGGIGVGIDRLTMFFTNTWSIKEVMLYPTMRPSQKAQTSTKPKAQVDGEKSQPVGMTREEAYKLLNDLVKNKNLVHHGEAVEAIMRALAKHFGEEEEEWGVVGLLHDADYEVTDKDPKRHTLVISEKLKELGVSEKVINAIKAHSDEIKPEKENLLEKAVYAADELSGLITACALVQPDKKLSSVSVESVMKKFPNKNFAAGAVREQIATCKDALGIELEDFVKLSLEAMQEVADDLGL